VENGICLFDLKFVIYLCSKKYMNVSSQIGSDLFETLGILSISSVQNNFLNEFKNLAITKLEEETLKILLEKIKENFSSDTFI
jgi:hypothetical protein